MATWQVERVLHFGSDDLLVDGLAHFGFHVRGAGYHAIAHRRHILAAVDDRGRLRWTAAAEPVATRVPNITVPLDYPMYVDRLADGSLVVSNFGSTCIYRIDAERRTAELLVDGRALGMVDMGNCVVDREGSIWVNEVTGCRVWQLEASGRVVRVLGDGSAGFQRDPVGFDEVRFGWIYDLRRGPDDRLYVLDSHNFALRVIEPAAQRVVTLVGDGTAGRAAEDEDIATARFGSDPGATFDGPISLAIDEAGRAFVGDRYNHVVRMVDPASRRVTIIAGRAAADDEMPNDDDLRDPRHLNLPQISSLDYDAGRLYVPTDLGRGRGDLAVLTRGHAQKGS